MSFEYWVHALIFDGVQIECSALFHVSWMALVLKVWSGDSQGSMTQNQGFCDFLILLLTIIRVILLIKQCQLESND